MKSSLLQKLIWKKYCNDLADMFGEFFSAKRELPSAIFAESDLAIII